MFCGADLWRPLCLLTQVEEEASRVTAYTEVARRERLNEPSRGLAFLIGLSALFG